MGFNLDDEWDDEEWEGAYVGDCCCEPDCLEDGDAECYGCHEPLCGEHWVATNGYCSACLSAPKTGRRT